MLGGISQSFVLGMRLPIIQVDEGQAIQQHLKFLRLKYGQVILWYNLIYLARDCLNKWFDLLVRKVLDAEIHILLLILFANWN